MNDSVCNNGVIKSTECAEVGRFLLTVMMLCSCARPYMAELGFVGDGPNSYQLWLGGNVAQTALAQEYMDRVKVRDLEKVLEPLLAFWKNGRRDGEGFGYFTARMGMEVRLYASSSIFVGAKRCLNAGTV